MFSNGVRSDLPVPGPDGEPLRDAAGRPVMRPQERPRSVPPPCGTCPKTDGLAVRTPLADEDDPCGPDAGWVWEVVPAVRGLLAWGQPPPDPVTEQLGVVVAEHDRMDDRRAMLRAVTQALKRE